MKNINLTPILLLWVAICAFLSSCEVTTEPVVTSQPAPGTAKLAAAGELIFNSGFQPGTSLSAVSAQNDKFLGIDNSVSAPNSWPGLDNHPNIGYLRINYNGGTTAQRRATIAPDPTNAANSNKVLQYVIFEPNETTPASETYTANGTPYLKKGRVQTELYGNTGLTEIYQSVRLYLPSSFTHLVSNNYPTTADWITLMEFWNNAGWVNPNYDFRISVNLKKGSPTNGSPLYFQIKGQTYPPYTTIWENTANNTFQVPIGQWMTLEYYYKEGNGGTGRFYLAVTPTGGTKTVVFDQNVATCHPDDPAPDGLSELNPIKLYTSDYVLNRFNTNGRVMQVFWDDFKLWKNKTP